MAINNDFSIDYTNKRIYHSSGVTTYSVNALYSWIQDEFDELNQLDDAVPMSAQTPTAYTMINGWYIDDESTKFLYSGAIVTSGWLNEIHVIQFGATYTSAIAGDIGKAVLDDGGAFGTLLAYDNTLKKWWVRTGSSTVAASGSAITITAGTGQGTSSANSVTGENLWTNVYTLGSIESGSTVYIEQNGSILTSWWSTGHIDVLIKVKEMGTEIDGANITCFVREFSDTYDHFDIDLTAGGRQAVPLATSNDLNNQTALATIEDYQDGTTATIAIAYGSYSVDVNNNGTPENYEVQIDCNGQRLSYVYEVCKYWARRGSTTTLDSLNGSIYIAADGAYTPVKQSPLGTFAGGKFFGARGVYLTNLHSSDVQSYQLIDSDGNTVVPPNYVAVAVSSLVSGDRVAVFPAATGSVNKSQYSSHAASNSSGDTTFVTSASLASDTPSSGTLIVVATDEKQEHVYRFTSWTGSTLTLPTAISSIATGGDTDTLIDSGQTFLSSTILAGDIIKDTTNGEIAYVISVDSDTQLTTTVKTTSWSGSNYVSHNLVQTYDGSDTVYIPYLYRTADATSENQTIIYASDRDVITRVRKKGILPFEVSGTITSSGLSVTAIRTTDSIVT
jgi:hypothetical protein